MAILLRNAEESALVAACPSWRGWRPTRADPFGIDVRDGEKVVINDEV